METLHQLLQAKGGKVWTAGPEETVLDALKTMAEKNVGALVVVEDGSPVGIFTERHYAREVFLKGRHSPSTIIRDVMSKQVVCASPDKSIDECMAVMSDKRIRHLPVVRDGRMIGIVSMGDLVRSKLAGQEFLIDQLTHYIQG